MRMEDTFSYVIFPFLLNIHFYMRMEDSTVISDGKGGSEMSNYSTVFLPWGPYILYIYIVYIHIC